MQSCHFRCKAGISHLAYELSRMKRSAAHKPPNVPIYASKGNEHRLFSSGEIIGKWEDLHQPTRSSLQPSSCIPTRLLLEASPYDIGDATKLLAAGRWISMTSGACWPPVSIRNPHMQTRINCAACIVSQIIFF